MNGMKKPFVFVTRKIPDAAIKLLRDNNFLVKVYSKDLPIPKDLLLKNIVNADAVISLLTEKFDPPVIDSLNRCKIIANYAVGYNNIDVKYAAQKNIIVTNTPDVLTDSTADLAIALLLACARRINEAENFTRAGLYKAWKPDLLLGIELKNKYFGILGAGRIGTAAAVRAKAFGMKILYFSDMKNEYLEKNLGAQKLSLSSVLKKSDFISVHLPLTGKTFHLLNKERLALLKSSAVLINTSRGEVIDETELIKVLKQKRIYAAGLDVYENEPGINKELFKIRNAVLLPHIGSATVEARTEMALLAAKNVAAVLSGKKALTPVIL